MLQLTAKQATRGVLGVRWRLLDSGPGGAALNMATDEALMLSHGRGEALPTLRFYAWRPAAVSTGRSQYLDREVDIDACRRLGIEWVRRPTGGRAVLHDKEVTYSIVISQALVPGSVIETYRHLSRGLLEGLKRLGVDAAVYEPPGRGGPLPASPAAALAMRGAAAGCADVPSDDDADDEGEAAADGGANEGGAAGAALSGACFDAPSWYELLAGGRKVVGSAQMRAGGVILQHGSILLRFDADRLLSVLATTPRDPAARQELRSHLERRAAGLSGLTGRTLTYDEVVAAMTWGFKRALGVDLDPQELTLREAGEAARLLAKYTSGDWNSGPTRRREP